MKKTVLITVITVIVTLTGLFIFVGISTDGQSEYSFAEAKKGDFEIVVTGTGELEAGKTVDINGPDIVNNRNFRAQGIRILDLVPEGTIVKKGDYIATLDRSSFDNRLKDESENLKNMQVDFQMAVLDSAVTLTGLRDEIKNQQYNMEESEILLEQSKFEPPSVQHKAEVDLDRQTRLFDQQKKNYYLRYKQTLANLKTLQTGLDKQKRIVHDLQELLTSFTALIVRPCSVSHSWVACGGLHWGAMPIVTSPFTKLG